MNRDDIIRIAREAGFVTDEADFIYPPKTIRRGIGLEIERVIVLAAAEKDKEIARLHEENVYLKEVYEDLVEDRKELFDDLDKAVAAEREACAKVCDARVIGDHNREDQEAKRCAEAIRARGEA